MEAVAGGGWVGGKMLSVGPELEQGLLSSSHVLSGMGGPGLVGHVDHEVHHPVGVARFVVIPGLGLIKFIEGIAGTSVKVGSMGVTVKIIGDNPVLRITQDAL